MARQDRADLIHNRCQVFVLIVGAALRGGKIHLLALYDLGHFGFGSGNCCGESLARLIILPTLLQIHKL